MGEMFDDADEASYVEAIPIHLFQDTSEVEQYPAPCQHSTYIIITPDLNERSDVHPLLSSTHAREPSSEVPNTFTTPSPNSA